MERLTDRETAEVLRRNIEALEKVGLKANASDLRYIRLAEYENAEEMHRSENEEDKNNGNVR